jgi:outer membrane receptor for ferrienterochelin and colicins
MALMLGQNAFAQDYLYGKVIDENGEPITNAEVHSDTKEKMNAEKVLTNRDGTFKIRLLIDNNPIIYLNVKSPGKDPIIKKPISDAKHNEFMRIEMEDKGVTSVTASRWEQSVHEVPASTVIISREEIAENGYMTLQEILENVPGLFTIDHRSETGITLGIRGFWSDFNKSVMIQVNGVNVLSERRNDFAFFRVNVAVEAIDKVEIVRGPMSVIYGAGAFFGVINIITNSEDSEVNSMISTGFGTQNTQQNFVRYSNNSNGWNLSFNAMTYRRDGFDENWDDMVSDEIYAADVDDPATVTISDYQGIPINKERYSKNEQGFNLSLSHGGFFSNINFAASDFGFSWSPFGRYWPGPKSRNFFKSYTGNYQVGYGGSLSDRFDYQIKATYMNSKADIDYNYIEETNFRIGEDRNSSVRLELNTKSILLHSEASKGLNIDLISGYYFNSNFENNSFYIAPQFNLFEWYLGLPLGSNVYTHSLYFQTEFKKGNSKFILGGRAELESKYNMLYTVNANASDGSGLAKREIEDVKPKTDIFFTPRLAYIYSLNEKKKTQNYLKAMLGSAVKQANVVQNTNDIMNTIFKETGSLPLPTDYLKPEKIWTAEIGYTFVYDSDSSDWEVNTNVFYNSLKSLITRLPTLQPDGAYIAYSSNSGQMQTLGAELIVKGKFKINNKNKHPLILKTDGSFTFQKTQIEPTQFDSPEVSFSPQALATLKFSAKQGKKSFAIQSNLVGSMYSYYNPAEVDETGVITAPGYYIGDKTKMYALMGVNFRWQDIRFSQKRQEQKNGYYFNLKFSNLFDAKYHYPTYTNTSWADKGYLGRGRQILLTMGYVF